MNKNNFDIEKFRNENIAIHCDTEEKAKDFINVLSEYDIKWKSGHHVFELINWDIHKEKTCYVLDFFGEGLGVSRNEFYKFFDFKIIDWEIEGDKKIKTYNIIEVLNMPVGTKLSCTFKDGSKWDYPVEVKDIGGIKLLDSTGEEFRLDKIIVNATFTELEKEIDWTKVPRGTKVQVRDYESSEWENKYFYGYNADVAFKYITTNVKKDDDFTGIKVKDKQVNWYYCRIHESEEIKEEWYK